MDSGCGVETFFFAVTIPASVYEEEIEIMD
jgi:hypothetical protein